MLYAIPSTTTSSSLSTTVGIKPAMSIGTQIPALPEHSGVSYLAEGAANVVYRLSIRYPTPDPSILEEYGDGTPPPAEIDVRDDEGNCQRVNLSVFDDKLLRLRKAVPNAIPCAESHDAFLRVIVPLFEPDQIVDQCLVKIRPTKLVQRLNGELEDIETNVDPDAEPPLVPRPVRRQGIYLADDEFGLLITDMMAIHGYDVIEFKPKWLAQSPSAPKNSVRCRQCAYVARQNAACKRKGEKLHKSFCPLDLVSDDYDNIFRVAEILLRPAKEKEVKLFADWIFATPLLRRLRDNQVMLDPVGPINANASDEKFRAAMTLRDVTVYLRYPSNVDDISDCSEARLGDLDIKSAEKGTTWREKERILIDEGWYEGKEAPADTQPLTCALSGPNRGFA